jgi:antitoxin component of MazEF toxin-antitoxin module
MATKAQTQGGNIADIGDEPTVKAEFAGTEDDQVTELNNHGLDFCGDKADILIPSTRGDDGKDAVFVGVNGSTFLIKRDQKVRIPVEILEALNNAIQDEFELDKRNDQLKSVKTPRFVVQVFQTIKAKK